MSSPDVKPSTIVVAGYVLVDVSEGWIQPGHNRRGHYLVKGRSVCRNQLVGVGQTPYRYGGRCLVCQDVLAARARRVVEAQQVTS